ncbi:MAG: lipopolysaccharide heptosyltransferase II [Victivallales bacterium]|nr:lipopolysaccharide heptosyltransferase II [Victivallales bacterium]
MSGTKNKKIDKILIIKPSSLGDIFHCFPAVALLGRAFPGARFDWFVRPELEDAVSYSPVKITRVIYFPRSRLGKIKTFLPAFVKAVNELRQEKYSLIVDFQGLLRSAVFTSLARSTQSVGFALPREPAARLAYSRKIHIPAGRIHAVDRYLALAEAVCSLKAPENLPELPVSEKFSRSLDLLLEKHAIDASCKLIGMIPGARWESKHWPPEFFAAVAKRVLAADSNCKILLIGSPADREAAEKITAAGTDGRIAVLAGDTSIGEMVEAIRRCVLIFSNDSGPIHIAAALRKPVFALFGPTDPAKTGPYGNIHHIFQRRLKCSKCLKKSCPLGTNACHDLDISLLADTLNNYLKSI